ncbi:RCC1 and BTB domain-containing protein 2 [Dermatophagoides farinae]|uniref:RCC1 and BTB domain-containing protein 2 n=1 Tax=Dermatophagoides farinae TaxID=6954 RepID=A0A922HTU4_DERFA|nr:RCC1 and BTB domain-containing protein 2 [Dermatophagoides farinae]
MARSATEIIDINLFQDDFKNMDQKFLPSVVSIISIFIYENYKPKKQFLLMTTEATFAYGEQICLWLSLEHDMSKPQRISLLNDMKIVQVDSGYDFVTILTEDGRVYLASNNSNWKTNNAFRLINTGNDCFKMIACGVRHLLLLRQDGHVFAMGDNRVGQITGNEKSSYESMINTGIANVKLIACGGDHSFSITNKEEIYSWGPNSYGQLGLSDKEISSTPCLVAFPNDDSINIRIKEIVAGDQHSLFLFENGQLWGCGYNYNGELGLGNRRSKLAKIPIGNLQQIKCSKSTTFHWHMMDHRTMHGAKPNMSNGYYRRNWMVIRHHLLLHQFRYQSMQMLSKICIEILLSNVFRNWNENDQVIINNYQYETYYAYLRLLHTGKIQINHQNITELVDLANCYGDESLMEYCATFIRNDLDEQTMPKYLPLINKYEMIELYEKLAHLYKNQNQQSSSSSKRTKFS